MRSQRLVPVFLPIIIFLGCASAEAIPIPTLDLAQLTRESDLIAVGQVINVWEESRTSIIMQGQYIQARQLRAQLQVERVIKGQLVQNNISFKFLVADFLGYREISTSQIGIFFLRKGIQQEYTVSNPYYPFVVASLEAPASQGDVFDRVVGEVAQVLTQPKSSRDDRLQAINVLKEVNQEAAAIALRRVTEGADTELRLQAVAALLWQNDVSVMKIAEEALLHPPTNVEKRLLTSLALAVEGIKDPRAIPNLTRLLSAQDVTTRRSAASALRHTGSPNAIEALIQALDDSDRDVRYNAVIGLAEITGEYEWGPSTDLFQSNEQRYLAHWKEWVKTR